MLILVLVVNGQRDAARKKRPECRSKEEKMKNVVCNKRTCETWISDERRGKGERTVALARRDKMYVDNKGREMVAIGW